jgi:hypothetical protein
MKEYDMSLIRREPFGNVEDVRVRTTNLCPLCRRSYDVNAGATRSGRRVDISETDSEYQEHATAGLLSV